MAQVVYTMSSNLVVQYCQCSHVPNIAELKIGLNKDLVIGKADQGSGVFKLVVY
jgi:hypothetical protein